MCVLLDTPCHLDFWKKANCIFFPCLSILPNNRIIYFHFLFRNLNYMILLLKNRSFDKNALFWIYIPEILNINFMDSTNSTVQEMINICNYYSVQKLNLHKTMYVNIIFVPLYGHLVIPYTLLYNRYIVDTIPKHAFTHALKRDISHFSFTLFRNAIPLSLFSAKP